MHWYLTHFDWHSIVAYFHNNKIQLIRNFLVNILLFYQMNLWFLFLFLRAIKLNKGQKGTGISILLKPLQCTLYPDILKNAQELSIIGPAEAYLKI